MTSKASPTSVENAQLRTASRCSLSAMLRSAAASVGSDRSTAWTLRAPPAAAWTLKPPVEANTSSTSRPAAIEPTPESVGALVEEVAGLLAGAHVGFEGEAALGEAHGAVGDDTGNHVAVAETECLAGLEVAGQP